MMVQKMMVHKCDICDKTFKTTQHLEQHKNKKKECVKPTESNNIILMTGPTVNSHVATTPITIPKVSPIVIPKINEDNLDILKFMDAYRHLGESVIEYKSQITKLTDENRALKNKLELIYKIIKDNTFIFTTDTHDTIN